MIKFSRRGNDLKSSIGLIPYVDKSINSRDYFKLQSFPSRLYVGKNSFQIYGDKDVFVVGSNIYIDVVDSTGKIIYHEILDVVNRDNSRTVVVYVYQDTPPGEAKVYIAGRIKKNPVTGEGIPYSENPISDQYKNRPNLVWVGNAIVVSNKENKSEIFYVNEPTINYSETKVAYRRVTSPADGDRASVTYGSSNSKVSIQSRLLPYQYSGNKSKFAGTFVDTPRKIQTSPTVVNESNGIYQAGPVKNLPEFTEPSVIRGSSKNMFTEDMKGGMIYVRDISVSNFIPRDAASTSSFTAIPDYSASILRVINSQTIEVDEPFYHKVSYRTTGGVTRDVVFDRFVSQANFTASYYSENVGLTTASLESFVTLDISNIEPSAGVVDLIGVSYKPIGSFGDFINVGQFPVSPKKLAVDTGSFYLSNDGGLKHTSYYQVTKGESATGSYWTGSAPTQDTESISYDQRDDYIMNGIHIAYTGSRLESDYVRFELKDQYMVNAIAGTEYKLSFASRGVYAQALVNDWTEPHVDVYISGSGITADSNIVSTNNNKLKHINLGTYIGSVRYKNGEIQDNELYFIAKDSAPIKPIFVIRSGDWDIGQVEIEPRKDIGFSPNQARFDIPTVNFRGNSELTLKVDYYNSEGLKADNSSLLYGIFISGSDDPGRFIVTDTGPGRLVVSTSEPSGAYATDALLHSQSRDDCQGIIYDYLKLMDNTKLSFDYDRVLGGSTNDRAYSLEYLDSDEYKYRAGKGTMYATTSLYLVGHDGQQWTGSTHLSNIMFRVESLSQAYDGGFGNVSTHLTLTSVVKGRASVDDRYNVLVNAPYIISGGQGGYGAFGEEIIGGSDVKYSIDVVYASDTTPCRIEFRHDIVGLESTLEGRVVSRIKILGNETTSI